LPASYVSTRRALLLSCLAATTAGLIALPCFAASSLTLEADSVILGYPLLGRCAVRIDYATRTLTLYRGDRFRDAGRSTVLPLTFRNGLPYVTARITLPGQQPVEGQFVIDSGSGQAVTLAAPFVRERRVLETVAHTIQGRGHGVGGESQSQVARLERLELGGFRLEQPIAALRTSSVGRIAAEGAIGNLGGEILHRFTVSRGVPLPSEGRCPICFSPCSALPCLPTAWAASSSSSST